MIAGMKYLQQALLAATLLAGPARLTHADGVDDYLKTQMAARHIPGLSVAVVQDGKVVKAAAYGVSDVSAKTPATPDTRYILGSCTKPFTAVAVLQLMEAGRVDLDAPISRYLAGLPAAWSAITVRELLTHTSGLPNYRKFLDLAHLSDPKYRRPGSAVALLTDKPLDFPPGTKYEYSNSNYHLLGQLVEKVSGQTYEDFLRSHQFQAAGMTATRLADLPALLPNQAVGYGWDGKKRRPNTLFLPRALDYGDDGLVSTAGDVAKWTIALSTGQLVSEATLKQMITPGTPTDGSASSYGLGLIAVPYKGQTLATHSGATPGYSSTIAYFVDSRLSVVVLCNLWSKTELGLTEPLALGVAKQYLPAVPVEAAIPDTDPQATQLLRRTLLSIAAGKVPPHTLTPQLAALLTPQTLRQVNQRLSALGPMQTLTPLAQTEQGGLKVYRYRVVYGTTPTVVRMAINADGKIAGLLAPQPE